MSIIYTFRSSLPGVLPIYFILAPYVAPIVRCDAYNIPFSILFRPIFNPFSDALYKAATRAKIAPTAPIMLPETPAAAPVKVVCAEVVVAVLPDPLVALVVVATVVA